MFSWRSVAGTAFLLTFIALRSELIAQDSTIETWRLAISIDDSQRVRSAVQYGIFDTDPVPGFKARFKSVVRYLQGQDTPANTIEKRASSLASACWDLSFKEVTGDRVYLVVRSPNATDVLHGSNSSDGKKWLVTKITEVNGKPVCWCVPIEVQTGRQIEVVLSENNMFDLTSAYQDARLASNVDPDLPREKSQKDLGGLQDYAAWSEKKMETAIRQFESKLDNDDTLDAANKQLVKDGFRKSLKKAFEAERAKTEGR